MATLTLKSQTTTDRLDTMIYDVLLDDIQEAIRFVAAEEILAQRSLGNPPSNIIVDNQAYKDIGQAQKRVQAFFGNTGDVREAVYAAWTRVQELTRRASGAAAASYQVWFNEQVIGNAPTAIESYLDRFNPATDYFRIVGPVLVYGRKVYWNPEGNSRFTRRAVRGVKFAGLAVRLKKIQGIMRLVELGLKTRYRGIVVTEDWVATSALPKDGRTPGLWIGFKKKGTTLNRGN